MRVLIDVRDRHEFLAGHIPGAINITPDKLMLGYVAELSTVPKSAEIIVYCRSGQRANAAKYILEDMGFVHVTNGVNMAHVGSKLQNNGTK